MFEFQPDKVHPELVARSKEMLLDIDVAKVQAVGPAAITFYVWVRIVTYGSLCTTDACSVFVSSLSFQHFSGSQVFVSV